MGQAVGWRDGSSAPALIGLQWALHHVLLRAAGAAGACGPPEWAQSKARGLAEAEGRRPVPWQADLLRAQGVRQSGGKFGVSDPGNKKEVAVVKMPDPGQLVCMWGFRNKEVLFSPDAPLLPRPPSLPGCSSAGCPPARPPSSAWSELC